MTGALHDPFGHGHMGVTAENIAAKYGFTRAQQDDLLASHRKAAKAMEAGYFKSQIVPIELKTRKASSSSRRTSTCARTRSRKTWRS